MSTAPGIVGIIAAGVLAGGLAACSTPTASAHLPAAAPSSATAVPVRVQPNAVGWSGMAQRPHHIYVGMGGAPVVRQLAWRNWGGPRATAAGKLDIYWPQPGPISGWRPTTYPVTVRLQGIQTHNGQPSYRTMADFYVNRRGVAKGLSFTFYVLPGGSVPAWNPGRGQGQAPPPDVPVPAAIKSRPLTRLAPPRTQGPVIRAACGSERPVVQSGPWFRGGKTRQLGLADH